MRRRGYSVKLGNWQACPFRNMRLLLPPPSSSSFDRCCLLLLRVHTQLLLLLLRLLQDIRSVKEMGWDERWKCYDPLNFVLWAIRYVPRPSSLLSLLFFFFTIQPNQHPWSMIHPSLLSNTQHHLQKSQIKVKSKLPREERKEGSEGASGNENKDRQRAKWWCVWERKREEWVGVNRENPQTKGGKQASNLLQYMV